MAASISSPAWVVRTELITPAPSKALANMLDTDIPASEPPPLWHWSHLLEKRPHVDLGPDGHPTFGMPAPPGPGRSRMLAGGRVSTYGPLVFDRPASRTTWVADNRENRAGGWVGRQFAYRLVAPMTGPQTFTVVAGPDGLNAGAEVRDLHGTVTAVSTSAPIG